jgi:serine/threonine protein phosphatase PrpC
MLIKERVELLNSQVDCERTLAEIDKIIASDEVAGETTTVVAVVSSEGIYGASVGDSGAWLVRGGGIDDLTAHQIRKPFLGMGAATPVGFSRTSCNGILLVATDGLLKYTSRERITATIQQTDFCAAPAALVSLVRYPSGALPDDVTVSLCRPL